MYCSERIPDCFLPNYSYVTLPGQGNGAGLSGHVCTLYVYTKQQMDGCSLHVINMEGPQNNFGIIKCHRMRQYYSWYIFLVISSNLSTF